MIMWTQPFTTSANCSLYLMQHSSSPTENVHKYINVCTQDICTQPDLFSCIFETPREGRRHGDLESREGTRRAGISNRDWWSQ